MQVIIGKQMRPMGAAAVAAWSAGYQDVTIDLGTGDGRFVRQLARQHRHHGAIGVDLCAANLAAASRRATENALFVVADALALPEELRRVATRVTINFPWGSLLRGLLDGHPDLLAGLEMMGRDGSTLDIRLNAGAIAEAGWTLAAGGERLTTVMRVAGMTIGAPCILGPADRHRWPSTWAKRLAFGRDPRAVWLTARLAHAATVTGEGSGPRHPSRPADDGVKIPATGRIIHRFRSATAG